MYYLVGYKLTDGEQTVNIVEKNTTDISYTSSLVKVLRGESTKAYFRKGDIIYFETGRVLDQDHNLEQLEKRMGIHLL